MRYVGLGLHVATALLITFKLVGALSWPWLWVLAPSICAFGIGLLLMALTGLALLMHKWAMCDPDYRLRQAFGNMQRALRNRR